MSAAGAVGLRIVRVRKDLKRVRATQRFRLFVTLKDRRGLLVRGATMSVGRVPGRTATASGVRAVRSGRAGTAQIAVRVKRSQFGKRLYVENRRPHAEGTRRRGAIGDPAQALSGSPTRGRRVALSGGSSPS